MQVENLIYSILTQQRVFYPQIQVNVLSAYTEISLFITSLGHGSPADCMERRGSVGLFRYDTGAVDLSERMAALWRSHATRASCFCVVKWTEKPLLKTNT